MNCTIAIPKFKEGLLRIYMQSKYTASLRRAGAKAVWIDPSDLDKAISEMLRCDGLLLSGGEDVNPLYYGQTPTEKCGKIMPQRDIAEMKMLEAFLATNKPILGICRGEQLMNVFFGGTLHQDIGHIATCCHKDFHQRGKGIHTVVPISGTKLAQIMGTEAFTVNSLHHQAVDTTAPSLVAAAVSEDGITEAIEHAEHPFCMGVQWHPEHMTSLSQRQRRIFDAFVKACKK